MVSVAKVVYGFGGGFGTQPKSAEGEGNSKEEGGGGGGGVKAFPAGALEITPSETRFVPLPDSRRERRVLLAGFAAGALVGTILSLRRLKS